VNLGGLQNNTGIRAMIQNISTQTTGRTSTASCPNTTTVIGGGCSTTADYDAWLNESYPSSDTWVCDYAAHGGWSNSWTVTAHAICL
jgi:hypothetical protein